MHKIVRVAFLLAAIQLAVLVAFAPQAKAADREVDTMDTETAERFARLALDCIEREYPNLIHHVMTGDDDVGPPRELTPAFYGCYDWHSAVHGHWLLTRLAAQMKMSYAPGDGWSLARLAVKMKMCLLTRSG